MEPGSAWSCSRFCSRTVLNECLTSVCYIAVFSVTIFFLPIKALRSLCEKVLFNLMY